MNAHWQDFLCNLTFSENLSWCRCGNTVEVKETDFLIYVRMVFITGSVFSPRVFFCKSLKSLKSLKSGYSMELTVSYGIPYSTLNSQSFKTTVLCKKKKKERESTTIKIQLMIVTLCCIYFFFSYVHIRFYQVNVYLFEMICLTIMHRFFFISRDLFFFFF